jgi:threonine/homoserine efflux transporter RhtA
MISTPTLRCYCIVLLHDQHIAIHIVGNTYFIAIDTIATPIVVAIAFVTTLNMCCKSVKSVALEGLCVATNITRCILLLLWSQVQQDLKKL